MAIPTPQEKLKVIVVGAGICGLACGAALREHADVTVSIASDDNISCLSLA
jgi:cation diffusion facilitator CzcD-associated flavoprotein CzcO